jgi:hypothetical protein
MVHQPSRTWDFDNRAFESTVDELSDGRPDQRPLTPAQRCQVAAYIAAIVRRPARAAAAESEEALMLGLWGQVPRYLRRAAGAVRALGLRGLLARDTATLGTARPASAHVREPGPEADDPVSVTGAPVPGGSCRPEEARSCPAARRRGRASSTATSSAGALFGCWPFTSSTPRATACGPFSRSPCGVSRSSPCSLRRFRACDEPLKSARADNAPSDARCRVGARNVAVQPFRGAAPGRSSVQRL